MWPYTEPKRLTPTNKCRFELCLCYPSPPVSFHPFLPISFHQPAETLPCQQSSTFRRNQQNHSTSSPPDRVSPQRNRIPTASPSLASSGSQTVPTPLFISDDAFANPDGYIDQYFSDPTLIHASEVPTTMMKRRSLPKF